MIALLAAFTLLVLVHALRGMTTSLNVLLQNMGQAEYHRLLRAPPREGEDIMVHWTNVQTLGLFIAVISVVHDTMEYVMRLAYLIFLVSACWTTILAFVRMLQVLAFVDMTSAWVFDALLNLTGFA